jgi:hypothetical protein
MEDKPDRRTGLHACADAHPIVERLPDVLDGA